MEEKKRKVELNDEEDPETYEVEEKKRKVELNDEEDPETYEVEEKKRKVELNDEEDPETYEVEEKKRKVELNDEEDPETYEVKEKKKKVKLNYEEDPETFEVEEIVNELHTPQGIKFLIKWKSYDELSWEPAENCNCDHLVLQFRSKQKNNGKPPRIIENNSKNEMKRKQQHLLPTSEPLRNHSKNKENDTECHIKKQFNSLFTQYCHFRELRLAIENSWDIIYKAVESKKKPHVVALGKVPWDKLRDIVAVQRDPSTDYMYYLFRYKPENVGFLDSNINKKLLYLELGDPLRYDDIPTCWKQKIIAFHQKNTLYYALEEKNLAIEKKYPDIAATLTESWHKHCKKMDRGGG